MVAGILSLAHSLTTRWSPEGVNTSYYKGQDSAMESHLAVQCSTCPGSACLMALELAWCLGDYEKLYQVLKALVYLV